MRARLAQQFTLTDLEESTGGPARYVSVAETGGKLGFITPMTHNFCESCNRVRLTCTGTLYMCLGQEDAADFRDLLRAGGRLRRVRKHVGNSPEVLDLRVTHPPVQPVSQLCRSFREVHGGCGASILWGKAGGEPTFEDCWLSSWPRRKNRRSVP